MTREEAVTQEETRSCTTRSCTNRLRPRGRYRREDHGPPRPTSWPSPLPLPLPLPPRLRRACVRMYGRTWVVRVLVCESAQLCLCHSTPRCACVKAPPGVLVSQHPQVCLYPPSLPLSPPARPRLSLSSPGALICLLRSRADWPPGASCPSLPLSLYLSANSLYHSPPLAASGQGGER